MGTRPRHVSSASRCIASMSCEQDRAGSSASGLALLSVARGSDPIKIFIYLVLEPADRATIADRPGELALSHGFVQPARAPPSLLFHLLSTECLHLRTLFRGFRPEWCGTC